MAEGVVSTTLETMGGNTDNRMLSYLPLAHVYERAWVECAALVAGNMQIFFAESLDTFLADLRRARPTVFYRCRDCGSSSSRASLANAAGKTRSAAAHTLPRSPGGTQGADRSGPG